MRWTSYHLSYFGLSEKLRSWVFNLTTPIILNWGQICSDS